jgi:hypothetical protein
MFCDGELKDALRRAGIKGISFEPARRSKAQEAALAKVLAFREIKATLQATPKVSLDDDPFERIYPFERIEEDKAPPE